MTDVGIAQEAPIRNLSVRSRKVRLPLREARARRAQELLATYRTFLARWIDNAGDEPPPPALPHVTIVDILSAAASHFNVSRLEIASSRQTLAVCYQRMVAMYLARHHTPHSFATIGQHFGDRDDTTVRSAALKAESLRSAGDPKFCADLAAIKQGLGVE